MFNKYSNTSPATLNCIAIMPQTPIIPDIAVINLTLLPCSRVPPSPQLWKVYLKTDPCCAPGILGH